VLLIEIAIKYNQNIMAKRRWALFFILVFFIIGIFLGVFGYQTLLAQNILPAATPVNPTFRNCPYHYINPLRCEPDRAPQKREYTTLRNDLIDYFKKQQQNGSLTTASIYFRDLENGPVLSINDQEDFSPASLLKVPLMITYLKKAQSDQSLLQRKVSVSGNFQSLPEQNIKPQQSAKIGGNYSIDELLALLITESDNNSWEALLTDLRKNYSENDFIITLSDLGIIDPRKSADHQYVTVQGYASIFRILYNSSYLNIPMSDKALNLLTHSDFPNGIVAGVPNTIKVAHKFGERKVGDDQQLHDCGIVYYTANPYLLCVMTRGHDISVLEQVIQHVSQNVFAEVQKRN